MAETYINATNAAWNGLNDAIEDEVSKEDLQNYAKNLYFSLLTERKMVTDVMGKEIEIKQHYIQELEIIINKYKTIVADMKKIEQSTTS